jgi:hypothetical protein
MHLVMDRDVAISPNPGDCFVVATVSELLAMTDSVSLLDFGPLDFFGIWYVFGFGIFL